VTEFYDDGSFLRWADAFPTGFVMNATPRPRSRPLVLHRATCRAMIGAAQRDATWSAGYRKLGSLRREELEGWAWKEYNMLVSRCRVCKP
jgi:hypothetical protein